MILQVKDWDKHFENNRTRELKELRFVILPNKHDGDGYTELLDHPNGAAHYGAWVAIVQVASKCDPRGTLLRDGDRAHDSVSLSRLTRLPREVFDEAIPRLLLIGWLAPADAQDEAEVPAAHIDSTKSREGAVPVSAQSRTRLRKSDTELNRREENRIEEKKDPSRSALAREVFLFWQEHLNHRGSVFDAKRGAAIMGRLKDGYTVDQLKDAVRGCALSDFHMGREAGKPSVHDGIALICKDAEHVDRFIAVALGSNGNGHKPKSLTGPELERMMST